MRQRWAALSVCSRLGIGACGSDDGGGGGDAASGGGKTLTIYSSMPLQGAASPQTEVDRQRHEARARAGKRQGGQVHRSSSCRWTTRLRRRAVGRRRPRRPTPARPRRTIPTAVYLGEFNSGAAAVSIPILNEAGVPHDQPGEHRRRPDRGGAGGDRGRARQVLPDGASATTRGSSPGTRSRARRWCR